MLYNNYANFVKLIILVLFLLPLQACEQADDAFSDNPQNESNRVSLSASELKADQKQIALALGECLRTKVSSVEHLGDSREVVAKRLHQICLPQFIALRQSKLAYVDVPDVFSPPPKVLQEELGMSYQIVDIRRQYIKELVHKRMQDNPMDINPHQYNPHKVLPNDTPHDSPHDSFKGHGKGLPPSNHLKPEYNPSQPASRI